MMQTLIDRFKRPGNSFSLLLLLRCLAFALLLGCAFLGQRIYPELISFIHWPLLSLAVVLAALLSLINLVGNKRFHETPHTFFTLVADTLLWFMAIAATGAAINPAISYVLVLLCIAAFTLPLLLACIILLLMGTAYAALMLYAPHYHHAMMMSWHLWGMWILFIANALIMLWVIVRLGALIREKDAAIAHFREETVRDEQLIATGTLAAAVTHEIGTPLSSIALLVEDKEDEDSLLIQQQVQRCKEAITTLRNARNSENTTLTVQELFKQLQQELLLIKPDAVIAWHDHCDIKLQCSAKLKHALLALIHNAVEASNNKVDVSCENSNGFSIDISHDGDPVANELLQQLGKQAVNSEKENGLGVGYYLANASIEQLGGKVEIHNFDKGVLTRVHLPIQRQLDD